MPVSCGRRASGRSVVPAACGMLLKAPTWRGEKARGWQQKADSHSSSRQAGRVEGRTRSRGGGALKQIITPKSQ